MSHKHSSFNDLPWQDNIHLQGLKRVFINNDETASALTQFAYGVMQCGQESGMHQHATMDEYFFFIKGNGVYDMDNQLINITPSSFVRIPAGTRHNLINKETELLEFVYFGIAI